MVSIFPMVKLLEVIKGECCRVWSHGCMKLVLVKEGYHLEDALQGVYLAGP